MNCSACGARLPAGAMFCGVCGRAVFAGAVQRAKIADPRPGDTTILSPDAVTRRVPTPAAVLDESLVQTIEMPQRFTATSTVPHMLVFSSGERVIVGGSGLLGRRPYPQPAEDFDQIVTIADIERSVSKTHLEFGLEDEDLWVRDRYSANGTVIIPPSGAPHRLEPGRRYRVPRGSRVEIGDHCFDVR